MRYHILIAGENNALLEEIRSVLTEQNYDVRLAYSGDEAMSQLKTKPVDLLVLGDALPGVAWIFVLKWLRHHGPISSLPVIILTADMDEITAKEAWHEGVDSFQSTREQHLPTLTAELSAKIRRILQSIREDR